MRLVPVDVIISNRDCNSKEVSLISKLMSLEIDTFGIVSDTTRMMLAYSILHCKYNDIDIYRSYPDNKLYMKIGDILIYDGSIPSSKDERIQIGKDLPIYDSIYHTVPSNKSELYRYLRSQGYINDDNARDIMSRVDTLLNPGMIYDVSDINAICMTVTKMKALRVYDMILSSN